MAQVDITSLGTSISGSVDTAQFQYYKLAVSVLPADLSVNDALTFALSPLSGDVDLYISTTANPVLDANKKCTNCILEGNSAHEEIKTITKTDPAFPAGPNAAFYIGVYGYIPSDFSLNVFVPSSKIVIEEASSQIALVRAASYQYFMFTLDDASNFTISVTDLSGDPDIYVSTVTQSPSKNSYQWAAFDFGFDLIEIETTHPSYKAQSTYYIAVYSFNDAYFSLSVAKTGSFASVLEGIPITGEVEGNQYRYFKHTLKQGGQELVFTVSTLEGSRDDPDIYITDDISKGYPSRTNCKWCQASMGNDIVVIKNAEAKTYYIGIFGYVQKAQFQLTAVTSAATTSLSLGVSQPSFVPQGSCTYFKHGHGDKDSTLSFSVIPFMGSVEVYSAMGNTRPDANKHDKVGTVVEGGQRVITYEQPSTVGTYYVGVCGAAASNFTILATTSQAYSRLVDSEIQLCMYLPTGYYRYFIYDVPSDYNNEDLAISVSPLQGDVDIFVSTTNTLPSTTNYTWKSDNWQQDTVVVTANDPNRGSRYYIAIYGASFAENNAFNINAFLSQSTIALQDGIGLSGVVSFKKYRYYSFNVINPGQVTITLELNSPSKNEANLYVSRTNPKPNIIDYDYMSTEFGNDILMFNAYSSGVYYVAVYSPYSENNQDVSYTINARQNYQSLGINRINMLSASNSGKTSLFHTNVYEGSNAVMLALTLINGRTKMMVFTDPNKDINVDAPDFISDTWPGNALYISSSDARFRIGEWRTVVYAYEDSDYFISASIPDYYTLIREGIPRLGYIPQGESMIYAHWLSDMDVAEDYYLYIRVMSGSMDVYVGQDYMWKPSPQNYTYTSTGPNDRIMVLANYVKNRNFYIGLYATTEHAYYEISIGRSSMPKYIALDQPQSQLTAEKQYSYFRILGSLTHPKRVLVYVESCSTQPAPVGYISYNPSNKMPTADNNDATSVALTSSKYVQRITTKELPLEEYFLGVQGLSNTPQTQYSVYATMDQDSRPIVLKPNFSGRTVGKQIELTISPALPPQRFVDRDLVYVVYIRELKTLNGKREVVNFDTVCGIQYYGLEIGKVSVTPTSTLKYLVDIDPKKYYAINVVVHDTLGLASPYTVGYISGGKLLPRNISTGARFSVGALFILFALIGIVIYFISGLGYNLYRGKGGLDLIPHREFWTDLPKLLLDGIKFITTCGRVDSDYSNFADESTGGTRNDEQQTSTANSGTYGSI